MKQVKSREEIEQAYDEMAEMFPFVSPWILKNHLEVNRNAQEMDVEALRAVVQEKEQVKFGLHSAR